MKPKELSSDPKKFPLLRKKTNEENKVNKNYQFNLKKPFIRKSSVDKKVP